MTRSTKATSRAGRPALRSAGIKAGLRVRRSKPVDSSKTATKKTFLSAKTKISPNKCFPKKVTADAKSDETDTKLKGAPNLGNKKPQHLKKAVANASKNGLQVMITV